MHPERRLGLVAALIAGSAGCYFLSDFEGLGGSTDTLGTGGTPASSSSTGSTTTGSTADSSGAEEAGAGCAPPDADYTGLAMNEIAPKGLPDDWIELRNNGAKAVPLCGVMITQDYDGITIPDGPDRFTFGDVYLAPGKYLVVASGPELPFGLSKDTPEHITLFSPSGDILDDTQWEATAESAFTAYESWARISDGTGPFKRINNPTKGTSNFELGGTGGAGGTGGGGAS